MATKSKSKSNSKAKSDIKPHEVEGKTCSLLHELISTFAMCVSSGSHQRCYHCSYNKTDRCALNSRRDAAALLKCVNIESVKFSSIPITYTDGENETTVFRPHFRFRTYGEKHYWTRMGNSNCFMIDTVEGIIYRDNLIQAIECCYSEDKSSSHPKCQNCPYHRLGCDEIRNLQILAFLMSITDSDVDMEALDAIMNPPLPVDPKTGMIIGSTEYLNYLDATFQLDD